MAGRCLYEHRGRVQQGRHLGRLLGAPTANFTLAMDTPVPFGTFAAVVEGLGRPYPAVAHVGVRPSVGPGLEPILEAYLLDFDGDLYGRELVVKLEHKVAEEIRVGSLEALARKIGNDVAAVRAYFTGRLWVTTVRSDEPRSGGRPARSASTARRSVAAVKVIALGELLGALLHASVFTCGA